MNECKACGGELKADRVYIHGMFDCHLFHPYTGRTVDELIGNWKSHIAGLIPAVFEDGQKVADIGPTTLCPAVVMAGKIELRRVGPMLHVGPDRKPDPEEVERYRAALESDPDIPRLLALSHNA